MCDMRKPPMTGEILQSLEILTRYRDTSLLKNSLMSTVLSLTRVAAVRLYDVLESEGEFLLALSAWSEGSEVLGVGDFPRDEQWRMVEPGSRMARVIDTQSPLLSHEGELYRVCVPIVVGNHAIAIFECDSLQPITEHEQDVLDGIIGVFRNYLDLLRDSQHDTLTGLLNRKTFERGFVALLTANYQHAMQGDDEQRNVVGDHWLAVMDIDHFKRINDKLGHLFGDEVLVLMSDLMRRSFRRHDRLYRFGGEEFVVLMRNVDEEGVRGKLESFRETVEHFNFPQVGQVTVSIGFAPVSAADTAPTVIGRADEALYFAKAHGRNRVCGYQQLLSSGDLAQVQGNREAEFF
jgi:diguanylate cyclase (GGDEF)-like protein